MIHALCIVLLFASACVQSIPVLGPAERDVPDGGGGSARDSEIDETPPPEDASTPIDPCGGCAAQELCDVDQCVPSAGIRSLDAHLSHTCMVRDGRAYCWGANESARLGLGDFDKRLSPTRVGNDNDWLQVSTGEEHTCGLRAPGALYCWGSNMTGQLAVGDTSERKVPTRATTDRLYRQLECGGDNCCAIANDATIDCWGDNHEGKIGQDDPFTAPDAVVPMRVGDAHWIDLTVGQGHVCAIRDDHALFCWGRNSTVELGIGPEPIQVRAPTRVGDAADWIDISASLHSTCGVRAGVGFSKVFCWGANSHRELGSPTIDELIDMPRLVGTDADWLSVHAGWFHTCARKQSGALYCWGRAIEGQLGQGGGDEPIAEPTLFAAAPGFALVALGNFYTCGVTSDGALMGWGANDVGMLGTGDADRRYEPATIP